MCGIAGLAADDPRTDVQPRLRRLSEALKHRGPDGTGEHLARGASVGIAHRRLSIVDLACGLQPMASEDGRVIVSYNGEIYNHADLRLELERLGHRFASRADTEVLVHGWEEWGEALLPRLNGIYAFAVLDIRQGDERWTLTLARDPVGAKPLFVGRGAGLWWFASELGAARQAGLVDETLDPAALGEYLVYRYVPAPRTMFTGTWKLPPSHLLQITPETREPRFRHFAHGFAPSVVPAGRHAWAEALRDGIGAAVGRQLMADVPVGSLLSGGVDSVLITTHMRRRLPEPPACFAIGFGSDPANELVPARRAAAALGVPLSAVEVDDDAYLRAWPELLERQGEPIANSGLLLVGLLCAVVARTHKVVLTGQGADEPLGGYPRHAAERLHRLARPARALLGIVPERWAESDRLDRLRRVVRHDAEARRFTEIMAVFGPAAASALVRGQVDEAVLVNPVERALAHVGDGDTLNRLLATDARLSLADDLLTVADLMSMRHGVELRVPFLDLPLLALLERLPARYKVSALGGRKWFYRQAVAPDLPPAIARQLVGFRARTGRKLGFATPLDRWFGAWVRDDAEQRLLGSGSRIGDVLDAELVRGIIREARDAGRPRGRQLMSLFVLESWLQGVSTGAADAAA